MSWSAQQEQAIKAVIAWANDKSAPQVFRLFGYAGTGKTTIAKEIAERVGGHVPFAAFTGKASLVLKSKGCDNAGTIHSLIYKVIDDGEGGKPKFVRNPECSLYFARLCIVDEVSMVGDELALDLLSFGCKVLVLGDPAQLPPVKGTGYFIDAKPDFMLTEIHRQAADNPIIRMSMEIREGRSLQMGAYGDSIVIPRARMSQRMVMDADQVLCGMNRTRRTTNMKMRNLMGRADPMPQVSDRLVCLRNNKDKQLLNGGLWDVSAVTGTSKTGEVLMAVKSQDNPIITYPVDVSVPPQFFLGTEDTLEYWRRRENDEFDYGYALTVHKSQGSQWPSILVIDESRVFKEDAAKHLYTAVTRAAEKVVVVL